MMLVKSEVKKPVSYVSKGLNEHEEKYHINEMEFWAVLWSLQQFRPHVYGRNVLLKTDSSVLKHVFEKADASKNLRLSRWVMELKNFNITVEHHKGAANVVADALSQNPAPTEGVFGGCIGAIIPGGYESRELAILQHTDPAIWKRVLALQKVGDKPFEDNRDFTPIEGILYKEVRTREGEICWYSPQS